MIQNKQYLRWMLVMLTGIVAGCGGELYAQGLVVNGATVLVQSGAVVEVDAGHITHQNNGTLNNNGLVKLDSNYLQTGTTTSYTGTGWLHFDGNSNQSFSGLTQLAKLGCSNGSLLTPGNNVTITDSVNFSGSGIINIAAHTLLLQPSAGLKNYGPNAYVRTNSTGTLQQTAAPADGAVLFPVGQSTYNPAILTNSGTSDVFAVRVADVVLDDGTSGTPVTMDVVNRTWMIDEALAGGSDVTLKLQWFNLEELAAFDRASCGIAHHNGSSWADPPSTNSATDEGSGYWSTFLSGINSFSPFAVEDAEMPLPVELLAFSARPNAAVVDLTWHTASEQNSAWFEVERSADGKHFTRIARQAAAGTSSKEQKYVAVDLEPLNGWSYYRLRQVDVDGAVSYSQLEAVHRSLSEQQAAFRLYPNPASTHFFVDATAVNQLRLYNAVGQEVAQWQHTAGSQQHNLPRLGAGLYTLQLLHNGSFVGKCKLMVQPE